MLVSVVICSHTIDRYDDVTEAVESLKRQTYDDVEIVLVADGDEALCDQFHETYGAESDIVIRCNAENRGLSASRNVGVDASSGEIIAFLDDDAIAHEDWLEELVSVYQESDAIAVGGEMVAEWVDGKPSFLPEEFYWLVGVTHRGFGNPGDEVRNTFGSNISFRRAVFEELDGFDPDVGRRGARNLQADETVFCARMREVFGHGVVYHPEAKVAHKVFAYRTRFRWLLDRAFWQGYSKWRFRGLTDGGAETAESTFLKQLLVRFIPSRVKSLVRRPSFAKLKQLVAIGVFTGAVGLGFVYGMLRSLIR